MSNKKKVARRRFFVDTTVQGAIARRLIGHWVLAILVLCVFLLSTQILIEGVYLPLSHHLTLIWQNYGLALVSLTALLPVFIYDAVKLSHKFAGPMVSFRRSLHQLADGEPIERIDFRKTDFWQPLTEDLNRVAERLNAIQPSTEGRDQVSNVDDTKQLVQS